MLETAKGIDVTKTLLGSQRGIAFLESHTMTDQVLFLLG
jgi:hypothetical protein